VFSALHNIQDPNSLFDAGSEDYADSVHPLVRKKHFFNPEAELEGVFNVIDSKSLVYFELAFLRILQFSRVEGGSRNG
jgi:hypothetical protein